MALDEGAGFFGFGAGGGWVFGHRKDGGGDFLFVRLDVHIEEPVAEADGAPHVALGGLLGPAANDGGNAGPRNTRKTLKNQGGELPANGRGWARI